MTVSDTVNQGLAYHTVAEAMQNKHRQDAGARFALAVKSCIEGHRPYATFRAAACERRIQGWNDEMVFKAILDWIQTDLNPLIQISRVTVGSAKVVEVFNLYNDAVSLAVKTNLGTDGLRRQLICADRDDELCRASTLALLQILLNNVATQHRDDTLEIQSVWRTALYLGAERLASAEAMRLLEVHGDFDLSSLSFSLGCSARTLQRQVLAEGLNVTELRMAARQQRAFRLLQDNKALCLVAHEAGYADQAHMARNFKAACGLTPRQIAQSLRR